MITRYSRKIGLLLSSNHTECGAMKMTNHFISAHSVAGNTTAATFIAAIPCMRHIGSRIKAKWKLFRGK